MTLNGLKVVFDDPEHGWIALMISCGETSVTIVTEYTPRDSFLELANALYNLLMRDGEFIVRWQYNPTEYDMSFERKGAAVSMNVVEYPDRLRREGRGDLMFSISGSYADICLPFWRALRDLQGRFSPEELDSKWHRAFPSREIDILTNAIRNRKESNATRI